VRADANDVTQVQAVAARAGARARAGEGPTLIEFHTYRIYEHCGVNEDHDLGYRSREEVDAWRAVGPLERGRSLVDDREVAQMTQEIEAEIDEAWRYARSAPWPTSLTVEGATR
jgi:pyruvate dehydrogenase E1 component alpha subunit